MTSIITQLVKNLTAMLETQVRFLCWEDLLEKEMETHSSILVWRIPWTEEPGAYIVITFKTDWSRLKIETEKCVDITDLPQFWSSFQRVGWSGQDGEAALEGSFISVQFREYPVWIL